MALASSISVLRKRDGPTWVHAAPLSPTLQMAQPGATTRSLLEVTLGFLGALLIIPLVFKTVGGLLKGIFRLGVTKRLLADVAFAGVTALLTRTDVLDTLFGQKGDKGAMLKSDTKR